MGLDPLPGVIAVDIISHVRRGYLPGRCGLCCEHVQDDIAVTGKELAVDVLHGSIVGVPYCPALARCLVRDRQLLGASPVGYEAAMEAWLSALREYSNPHRLSVEMNRDEVA